MTDHSKTCQCVVCLFAHVYGATPESDRAAQVEMAAIHAAFELEIVERPAVEATGPLEATS